MWAGTLSYSAVKLFSKYSNLCDHGTWTSRTDRRTDDILRHNPALRSIAQENISFNKGYEKIKHIKYTYAASVLVVLVVFLSAAINFAN